MLPIYCYMTTYHYDSRGHLYCTHEGVLYSWLGVFAEHNAAQILAHVTSTPWTRHLWEPMQALRGQSAESFLR